MAAGVKSLRSVTLPLPPSCIQFCPSDPRRFVVGTYFLHRQGHAADDNDDDDDGDGDGDALSPAPQRRTGSVILYELAPENNNITELSTIATDFAILDIQWTLHPDQQLGAVLAAATSTGSLAFYRLGPAAVVAAASDITQQPQLVESCIQHIVDDKTLVLALTWHPHRPDVLGLTLSDGRVCLCTSAGGSGALWGQDAVLSLVSVHEHELEAWMVSFTPASAMVLSGGDDMVLQCSRVTPADVQVHERLWQDRKLHEAGVTAILPLSDSLVVTGSYDDHIRLLSLPAVGRRKVLAELHLGGGVWRLKLLTHSSSSSSQLNGRPEVGAVPALQDCTRLTLLCSCMHAGTRIVSLIRVREDEWQFHVLARFEEHKSMNYGSDVLRQGGGGEVNSKTTVVSTSFYDQLMCVWQVDLDALSTTEGVMDE